MSARGKIEREIRFRSWARSSTRAGRRTAGAIAFSGLVGGLTDLYVYDLEADSLQRLTNDAFADLQPAWSPDGRTHRVRHRPVHHRARTTGGRAATRSACWTVASGPDQPGAGLRAAPSTSTRSGRPTARASTSCPIPTGSPTSTGSQLADGAAAPGHQPVHRRQRHHRDQPRADGGRSERAAWCTASSAPTATSSTPSTAPQALAGQPAAAAPRAWRPPAPAAARARERAARWSCCTTPRPGCPPDTDFPVAALPAQALAHLRRPAVADRRDRASSGPTSAAGRRSTSATSWATTT